MKSLMEKEIFEQSGIIAELAQKYIVNYCVMVEFPSKVEKVKFIASGSSYNCARLGAKFFEETADIEATCEFSSEFLSSKTRKVDPEALYYFISQSGETNDTLEAMDIVKKAGARTFALVNNSNSTLYDNADFSLDTLAGPEMSIAATKSFTASVFCTWLCALKAAQNRAKDISKYVKNISDIGKDIEEVFLLSGKIDKAAAFLANTKSFSVIGYDYYYALAKEACLKIRETSFIDANAYPLGEFVHGHVAILNKQSALVEIFTADVSPFEIKNLRKIQEGYNPQVVAVTDFGGKLKAKHIIEFKKINCTITRVVCIAVILQLLALKTAYKLKRNVDSPQGLSKVVF